MALLRPQPQTTLALTTGAGGAAAFRDEIAGARAHGTDRVLLAARAGDDDEGQVGIEQLDQLQRFVATEAGHVVVGNDDVPVMGDQGGAEIWTGVDARDVWLESLTLQFALEQLRVVVGIFDHQDGNRPRHLQVLPATESWTRLKDAQIGCHGER